MLGVGMMPGKQYAAACVKIPNVDYSKLDDFALISLVARRDETALSTLYDRYSRLVFSLAVRIVGERTLAEEITAYVFVNAWRSASSFAQERGRFVAWLMSITRHRAIDELRRLSVRPEGSAVDLNEAMNTAQSDGVDELVGVKRQRELVRTAFCAGLRASFNRPGEDGTTNPPALAAAVGPVELSMSPAPDSPEWAGIPLPACIETSAQSEGDLGERMARAAQRAIAQGEVVLLTGTDCPQLTATRLREAAAQLTGHNAVLYRAEDGGYPLLGLRAFDTSLFTDIPWSTSTVADLTLERMAALKWRVWVGETLRDIDEPADLAWLPKTLRPD